MTEIGMPKTVSVLILLFVSVAIQAAETPEVFYLSKSLNDELSQCVDHDIPPEHENNSMIAYALATCANYSKLHDRDFKRAQELELATEVYVSKLPCDCSMHNHHDMLMYQTYYEMSLVLEEGLMPASMMEYCKDVVVGVRGVEK